MIMIMMIDDDDDDDDDNNNNIPHHPRLKNPKPTLIQHRHANQEK